MTAIPLELRNDLSIATIPFNVSTTIKCMDLCVSVR